MRQHYQEKIHNNSGDIKKTWKIINEVINKSKKANKILKNENNEIIDQADIPNQFNKYFIELGDNLSNDIPLSTSTPDRYFTNFQCPRKLEENLLQGTLKFFQSTSTSKSEFT